MAARAAAEEGRELADAIGDRINSRQCRQGLGYALISLGELAEAVLQFNANLALAEADRTDVFKPGTFQGLSLALGYQGEVIAARAAAEAGLEAAAEIGEFQAGMAYTALANVELAVGDVAAACDASETAQQRLSVQPYAAISNTAHIVTKVALASGDFEAARRYADEAIAATTGVAPGGGPDDARADLDRGRSARRRGTRRLRCARDRGRAAE